MRFLIWLHADHVKQELMIFFPITLTWFVAHSTFPLCNAASVIHQVSVSVWFSFWACRSVLLFTLSICAKVIMFFWIYFLCAVLSASRIAQLPLALRSCLWKTLLKFKFVYIYYLIWGRLKSLSCWSCHPQISCISILLRYLLYLSIMFDTFLHDFI